MREIKFRAWDKERKVMHTKDAAGFVVRFNGEVNSIVLENSQPIVTVYAENLVLMQYTGLKDKNGTKIYEGDIIKGFIPELANEPQRKGFVKWGSYSWIIDFELPKHAPGIGMVGFCSFRDYEVIGNIYENPELLEVEQ